MLTRSPIEDESPLVSLDIYLQAKCSLSNFDDSAGPL